MQAPQRDLPLGQVATLRIRFLLLPCIHFSYSSLCGPSITCYAEADPILSTKVKVKIFRSSINPEKGLLYM